MLPFDVRVGAAVTDRVEIEFDWNQEENKLVGKPAIKNFPSKAGTIVPMAECPATKVNGAFEFITILSLKDQVVGGLQRLCRPVILPPLAGPAGVFHLMSTLSPIDRDLALVYSPPLPVSFRDLLMSRGLDLVEVPDEEFESMGCDFLALGPRLCRKGSGGPT